MSATVGTNSYISKADADTYFTSRLHSSKWTSASDTDKEAALVQATRMIDEMFDFRGILTVDTQTLRWPRKFARDFENRAIPDTEIPVRVKNATCEQAIYLLAIDATQKPTVAQQGFKTASAGPLSVEADASKRPDMICQAAITAIGSLGTPRNGATVGGANVLEVIRS